MKKLILCALFASLSAHADENSRCLSVGQAFQVIAQYRDTGMPPKMSLGVLANKSSIPVDTWKKWINLVYFDPRFVNAGGEPLFHQIYEACMYPNGREQPLK